MRRNLSIWILTVSLNAMAQIQVWNMDHCMRYAVDHSTTVKKSKLELSSAKADYQSAIASFFPKVTGEVSGEYNWGRNIDPETNTYNTVTTFNNYYEIYASLDIFDGGQTFNQFKQARILHQQGKNNIQKAQDDKAIEVMQKFIDATYYHECIRLATDKLADSRNLLKQTKRMEELGMKGHPDVAQIESQVAEDDYNLTHQKNQFRTALLALKSSMNYPITDSLDLDTTYQRFIPANVAGTVDSIYNKAVDVNTDALNANFNIRNARYKYLIEKGKLLPTISLSAGVATNYYKNITSGGTSLSFNKQFNENMGEFVYATLSIPIFNFSLYKNAKKAHNDLQIAMLDRDDTLRKLHDDIEQAVMDCEGYAKEIVQMERKVTADSIAYHLAHRKYEEGMLSAIDLQTSVNTLLKSRISLLQMYMMYTMKERLVDYYKGMNLIKS